MVDILLPLFCWQITSRCKPSAAFQPVWQLQKKYSQLVAASKVHRSKMAILETMLPISLSGILHYHCLHLYTLIRITNGQWFANQQQDTSCLLHTQSRIYAANIWNPLCSDTYWSPNVFWCSAGRVNRCWSSLSSLWSTFLHLITTWLAARIGSVIVRFVLKIFWHLESSFNRTMNWSEHFFIIFSNDDDDPGIWWCNKHIGWFQCVCVTNTSCQSFTHRDVEIREAPLLPYWPYAISELAGCVCRYPDLHFTSI